MFGVALGQIVVDGDDVHRHAGERRGAGGQRAVSVLPSPVSISASWPSSIA